MRRSSFDFTPLKRADAPTLSIPTLSHEGLKRELAKLLIAIFCYATKLFLNADELVVLRHTVGTAHRTGLDLA